MKRLLNYSVLLNEENYYKYFGIHKDLINFLSELNQRETGFLVYLEKTSSKQRDFK